MSFAWHQIWVSAKVDATAKGGWAAVMRPFAKLL